MFRKEYKQANDNIKVDEALLEKTLEAAFSAKPKKKAYYYRPVTSVAAALVLIIGVSVAYPGLVEKPVTETTIIATPEPVANLQFDAAVPEPAPVVTQEVRVAKKSKQTKASSKPTNAQEPVTVQTEEFAAEDTAEPAIDAPVPENTVQEPASFSLARAGADETSAAYTPEMASVSEFVQISYKTLDGVEVYVYENEEGKSFTVTVTEDNGSDTAGFKLVIDGKAYLLQSENMTQEELSKAFEDINI